ncbi:DNA mismatch repair protein MutS [Massilibacterium senegalense]|uniref:DNA mismatch repair protein MutS n=1 Tax=Massilibacterium senegalense TaxID=1632858 RepID=UPI000782012B|nr:DNA mismatch repair protein MutS [Massilibacterium senegalense]
MAKYTPMIQQYLQIKGQYEDAFLFFRLGDFYELFFEDAIKASQELEITLTGRDGGTNEKIPMCGVPYHAAKDYISTLIEKGYKVAICEQVEDPKQAKGVVKREVIQLITPGTVMEGKLLNEKENNYIASVTEANDQYGFVYADLSTGEIKLTVLSSFDEVLIECSANEVKELIVDSSVSDEWKKQFQKKQFVLFSTEEETAVPTVCSSLVPFTSALEQRTAGRLLQYFMKTQKRSLEHLQTIERYDVEHFMKLDLHARRNLELAETIRHKGKKGSLLWLMDDTMTAMGSRMMKRWIERPLIQVEKIEKRLNMVDVLIQSFLERTELRNRLKEVYDLERLVARVAFGNVNARDLVQLRKTLEAVPAIRAIVHHLPNNQAKQLAEKMDPCESLCQLLKNGIIENPPMSVKEGGMIRDGFHEQLDRYRDASRNGKAWIAELEQKERQKTGVKSLKVGYNRVFGYYIEVTKANLHLLQEDDYERKQTLANAERFITPELKEKEALILEAEEKIISLEYELFQSIREQVKPYIQNLQQLAKTISELDCYLSFATISENYHYTRPFFSNNGSLMISSGRHPVVERVMDQQVYVENDVHMNEEDRKLLLITGPNMSGKSTYMRQVALTSIMAQMGCFVPCEKATLPIFDQVFTRIGAADDLVSGQSTFMVEMMETNDALAKATKNSLLLLDEIGRGTSTYDGMALAQAIIEYIHEHVQAKTLFSTHYHELTSLSDSLPSLTNVHVSAVEENETVVFLHKVKEGPADKSYGIHVAKLAKLPEPLIIRASEILKQLETGEQKEQVEMVEERKQVEANAQLSFFAETVQEDKSVQKPSINKEEKQVLRDLQELDLLSMTPLDAMNTLYRLQKKMK